MNNLRQEILKVEIQSIIQKFGYESTTTQYHIDNYRKEFGDGKNFLEEVNE